MMQSIPIFFLAIIILMNSGGCIKMKDLTETITKNNQQYLRQDMVLKQYPGSEIKKEGDMLIFCNRNLCIPFSEKGPNIFVVQKGVPFFPITVIEKGLGSQARSGSLPIKSFEQVNAEGRGKLSDFKGKRTLIFCWASW
jgi:hypothetical protein